MLFGKNLKSVVFLFKKIQFQIRTWKNSIDIAVAYNSSVRSSSGFRKFLTTFLITFFSILFIALISFVGFQNRRQIAGSFQSLKKISGKISLKFPEKKPKSVPVISDSTSVVPVAVPEETVSEPADSLERADIGETTVAEIESTLSEPPLPELERPEVQKYVMNDIKDSSDYLILVANKAFKSMYLLQNQSNRWKVVREYEIAIGEQEGKKFFAGDKKTPEGQYFIIGRKEHSELSIIYGPLAYVLNYPNREDRLAGRTGQGIWIHGTDPDSIPIDTRGCLEMNNGDLKELSGILRRGLGTPVLIVNNPQLTDPTIAPDYLRCENERISIINDYKISTDKFREFIDKWKSSWETKNMVEYTTFYDTLQFKGQGLDWDGWRERKLRTFNIYDTISISISNILVTDYSDHSTIVKFFQQYTTNLNNNEVAKKLSLSKVDDSWKIISESTCSKEELLL